jgi:hypothetical protein
MRHVLKTGMRKRQGLSFVLVRGAWAALVLSLVLGLGVVRELVGPGRPALFGLLLLGGWLLTFLLAVLQRILPFLASMHATGAQAGTPARLSELGATLPLKVHAACHAFALIGLAAAVVLNSPDTVRVACVIGLAGAIAFAVFAGGVLRRVFAPRP